MRSRRVLALKGQQLEFSEARHLAIVQELSYTSPKKLTFGGKRKTRNPIVNNDQSHEEGISQSTLYSETNVALRGGILGRIYGPNINLYIYRNFK